MSLSDPIEVAAGPVIASLPGHVGFVPWRSLALVVLRAELDEFGREQAAVLRFDLTDDLDSILADTPAVLEALGPSFAVVVVIDDRLSPPRHEDTSPSGHGHALVRRVLGGLAPDPIRVHRFYATTAIITGSPWWSLTRAGESGTLPDPAATPAARQRDSLGIPVVESRTALAESLATDPSLAVQVSALLPDAVDAARERRSIVDHQQQMTALDSRDLSVASDQFGGDPLGRQTYALAGRGGDRRPSPRPRPASRPARRGDAATPRAAPPRLCGAARRGSGRR
ncbi:DUF4192 family protein [Nocardia takedensis]